jgi:hypothetical protein
LIRLRAVGPGRFSRRLIVGCEHRSWPLRQPPDRHRERAIGVECVAIVAVGIAHRDRQGAIADHLGQVVPHPVRVARVVEARRQPFGDLEPLLDGRRQPDAGIRSEPPAIETDRNRLAAERWQTRHNPRPSALAGANSGL